MKDKACRTCCGEKRDDGVVSTRGIVGQCSHSSTAFNAFLGRSFRCPPATATGTLATTPRLSRLAGATNVGRFGRDLFPSTRFFLPGTMSSVLTIPLFAFYSSVLPWAGWFGRELLLSTRSFRRGTKSPFTVHDASFTSGSKSNTKFSYIGQVGLICFLLLFSRSLSLAFTF